MDTHESEAAAKKVDEEVRRLVALLANLVRLSKRSMRSIEEELNYGSSVVSKFLNGGIRPSLDTVLAIAGALGVTPAEFFALAYPQKNPIKSPIVQQVLETEGLIVGGESGLPAELDARIESVVRRTLAKLGQTT